MASDFRGVSVHITITISPENVFRFFEEFQPVYEKVIAEPDCTYFEVFQLPDDPGVISWVENWTKPAEWLMQNQLRKEYYKAYFAATEPMYIKPREIRILKQVGAPFVMMKENNGGKKEF